jgi:SAM-dependent methyltransferase
MGQKDVFRNSEGDRYFTRNREKLTAAEAGAAGDPILESLRRFGVRPRSVLEIGCSNGWRLEALRREAGASCHGLDPSPQAVAEGVAAYPLLSLAVGTADSLPFPDATFDLVIFGFCLYLCDRKDLFRIAAEADRVLAEGGSLAILDFHPPFPYRNPYAHRPGLYSYKMDYSLLFRWSPAYTLVSQAIFVPPGAADPGAPDDRHAVSLLRKDSHHAYPEAPFSTPT